MERRLSVIITLPDFTKSFEYENNFYLSCDITRMSKMMAHYELFKMANDLPGAIIECGVFKGASLLRFAMYRELLSSPFSKKIIGFDIFGKFPETNFQDDIQFREKFIAGAGEDSISVDQLYEVLSHKGINKQIELVSGDITKTVPDYVKQHPELKISVLNLDTDIYEPSITILEHLYPRLVKGGILIMDDYGTFPGETKAVDDYFKHQDVEIRKFPFAMTPCYLIK
ncbi:TylF/MycF/NovP-related O-methyltransferase [Paenibacillus chungangensis]|uniref:TylF/MycF/NovP-related O-methyltransferase n=1 Tax=Paenibacillus chungangensis TaxID=696535 RepID=A0ABW3HWI7_9BACL